MALVRDPPEVEVDGDISSGPSSVLTSRSQSIQSLYDQSEGGCDDTACFCAPLPSQGEKEFLPAIATMSLGTAGVHSLVTKLEAAAAQGFKGIELFWDDLVAYAAETTNGLKSPGFLWESQGDMENIISASSAVRHTCERLGLTILALQPFRNYDGIIDKELHDQRIREFKFWLLVAQRLDAPVIGVPSTIGADSNSPAYTGDANVLASDLRELADLAQPYGVKIAYENLCFAKHTQSWAQAWDVISRTKRLDRIGFLPDTFNLCGDAYADPSRPGGLQIGGEKRLQQSMDKFCATIPMASVPYVQVADAEFMDPAITHGHPWMAGCSNPNMAWSRNARLFACEDEGCLPVVSILQSLAAAGWSGWVSQEVFSRTTKAEGEDTIHEHARRAWRSWEKLAQAMKWPTLPVRYEKASASSPRQ